MQEVALARARLALAGLVQVTVKMGTAGAVPRVAVPLKKVGQKFASCFGCHQQKQ